MLSGTTKDLTKSWANLGRRKSAFDLRAFDVCKACLASVAQLCLVRQGER
jgi:hypothetical protein